MGSEIATVTPEEVREFDELGCLVVEDALSREKVSRLVSALDNLTQHEPDRIHNTADILGLSDEFLDLIDLPTVLPKIRLFLGDNIWVNHSHFNVNPPPPAESKKNPDIDYGWHRDGGAINTDVPPPAPLLSIKVGFYLSDLSELGCGQTYFLGGSHKSGETLPDNHVLPPTAVPMCVKPGTAVIFDRRMIHSIRSLNTSPITRKAIFLQYAFRWLSPVDAMTVDSLRDRCSPARLQLLGLSAGYHTFDGAEGRSGRYYPTDLDVPIGKSAFGRISRRIRSLPKRVVKKLRR